MDVEPFRLLLVEDQPEDAEMLSAALAQAAGARFEVVREDRVSGACERLREEKFDLVLLDLTMPDEWGLDSLVRMTAQAPDLPIVIVASTADESLARAAVDAGGDDWIAKEKLDAEDLEKKITGAIQRHRLSLAGREPIEDRDTGLYNEAGFFKLARKHLQLASQTEKALLLFHATLAPGGASERAAADGARVLREAFRGSDLVARVRPDEFIALAIVHPIDNSEEVVAVRLDELLYAHNARSDEKLNFRFNLMRFQPTRVSSVDDLRTAFRGMIEARA